MPHMKRPLQHREHPLHRPPLRPDPPIPAPIRLTQRVTTNTPPHRRIKPPRLHPKVALVTVHHLTRLRQVHAAVVNRRRSHSHRPHEAEAQIRLNVQLKPEEGLPEPLRPRAVPAPPSQSVIPAGLAALARIRLNDRGVLRSFSTPPTPSRRAASAAHPRPPGPDPSRLGAPGRARSWCCPAPDPGTRGNAGS